MANELVRKVEQVEVKRKQFVNLKMMNSRLRIYATFSKKDSKELFEQAYPRSLLTKALNYIISFFPHITCSARALKNGIDYRA